MIVHDDVGLVFVNNLYDAVMNLIQDIEDTRFALHNITYTMEMLVSCQVIFSIRVWTCPCQDTLTDVLRDETSREVNMLISE